MPMTADYDRAVAENIIDLWEKDGDLIALIEVVPAASHLLIENIAVRPDRQEHGIGSKLLDHAEALARSHRLDAIELYTNAAFASNLAFYSRRGYQEYRRAMIEPFGLRVYMRKTIKPAD